MRFASGLCAALAAALLGACSGSPMSLSEKDKAPISSSAGRAAIEPIAPAAAFPPPASGTDAALQLEAQLGQHSILAADMMRARIQTAADLAQSANAALGQNTAAMAELLEPVIGAAAGAQFADAWAEHIQALFNYARGLATRDAQVKDEARDELLEHEEDLARFFAAQSRGRLDQAGALAAVRMHVDHLTDGADAYAARNYARAARLYRSSYANSFEIGATLARALLPADVGTALDSPAVTLRSSLTHLLGEHVALMMASVRSSVGDPDDFAAMAAAVNANTLELTAAFDSLFGSAAARRFQARWADHVDHLMAYTSATVRKDSAGQEEARQGMRDFDSSFAAFLNSATQNRLPESATVGMFQQYDRRLLAEIDAYVSNNHEQAQTLRQQIYGETFVVAQQLSNAIGATLGARLPRGGSQTGGGGTTVLRGG